MSKGWEFNKIFCALVFSLIILFSFSNVVHGQEYENLVDSKTRSSYYVDFLKIQWEKPDVQKGYEITGYKILRKTGTVGEYQVLIENTKSKETHFVDRDIKKDWYGYYVTPIIEKIKPDRITMHGIDRKSNLFDTYKEGQMLLAKNTMDKILFGKNIQNDETVIPKTIQYDILKRTEDTVLQNMQKYQAYKAWKFFEKSFDVKNNF